MFGLGMGELIVIFVVALLVLGPKKLPEVATGLGKAIRQFRQATRELQDQIEIDDSVRRPIQELKAALRDEPPPPVIAPAADVAPYAHDPHAPDGTLLAVDDHNPDGTPIAAAPPVPALPTPVAVSAPEAAPPSPPPAPPSDKARPV